VATWLSVRHVGSFTRRVQTRVIRTLLQEAEGQVVVPFRKKRNSSRPRRCGDAGRWRGTRGVDDTGRASAQGVRRAPTRGCVHWPVARTRPVCSTTREGKGETRPFMSSPALLLHIAGAWYDEGKVSQKFFVSRMKEPGSTRWELHASCSNTSHQGTTVGG